MAFPCQWPAMEVAKSITDNPQGGHIPPLLYETIDTTKYAFMYTKGGFSHVDECCTCLHGPENFGGRKSHVECYHMYLLPNRKLSMTISQPGFPLHGVLNAGGLKWSRSSRWSTCFCCILKLQLTSPVLA